MPQTSPMSWTLIITTMMIIMMTIKTTTSFKMNKPNSKTLIIKKLSWKW